MDSERIRKIVLRKVAVPLVEPFRISNGEVSVKESVVIELHSPHGIAYGEASPMSGSFYSPETPESTWQALKDDLIPLLLTNPYTTPEAFADILDDYAGEPFARAGIEGALWYLSALEGGTTIRSIFGAPEGSVSSGLAVGLYDTTEELLERIGRYMARGYARLKIKIMPGWDIEPLRAIRKQFGNVALMVDANAAYKLDEHSDVLKALDDFDLMMIEQPLARDAFEDLAALGRLVKTPICADESAESMQTLDTIIELGSASIINIKVQRVGGLRNAVAMLARAREAGLASWIGTMPELGIASAQALQIATLPGIMYPTDVEESERWFVDDIIEPRITLDPNGTITVPQTKAPMGYHVSQSRLTSFTTDQYELVTSMVA